MRSKASGPSPNSRVTRGHLDRDRAGFHIELEAAAVWRRLQLGLSAVLTPLAAGNPARRKSQGATNSDSFKAGQTYWVLGRFPFVSLQTLKRSSNGPG